MSLFGGSGFLGLGGTGFSRTISTLGNDVNKVVDFTTSLPNKLSKAGYDLGNIERNFFQKSGQTAATNLKQNAYSQKGATIGQNFGNLFSSNGFILALLAIGGLLLFRKN